MIPAVIVRWLIAGCIERSAPLPAWLRRRVDRSPDLARYARSLECVERGLADHAAVPMEPTPTHLGRKIADGLALAGDPRPAPSRSLLPLAAVACAAAAIGLVILLRSTPQPSPAGAPAPSIRRLADDLSRRPLTFVRGQIETPLDHQVRLLATQPRRAVDFFIKGLPGLPVGDSRAQPVDQ